LFKLKRDNLKPLIMKRYFAILLVITLSSAAVVPNQPIQHLTQSDNLEKVDNFKKGKLVYAEGMKRSDVETYLGRKLNLPEKIAFLLDKKGVVEKLTNSPGEKNGFNVLAIAGFASAVAGFFFLPLVLSTVGVVLSAIAMGKTKKNNQRGRGLAIAGLVAGIAGLAFAALILAAFILV
jgi:hypothetical protein